ncbi:MAG: NFACT RNA binding domain-containing protein [Oscillospiraceae bacterium]
MAFDGITLSLVKNELEKSLLEGRVEKIYQPSKSELVFLMRTRNGAFKLYMSADASSARIHLTSYSPENPQKPPMFCMLLRKHLTGAILKEIKQIELDRVLLLCFDATNEIGDKTKFTLCIEIMAQRSNIILIDENEKIIDAIKRVDETKSYFREVLPGGTYVLPPHQDKFNILTNENEEIIKSILSFETKKADGAILNALQGISPIVSREIASRINADEKNPAEFTKENIELLQKEISALRVTAKSSEICPQIIFDIDGRPLDFSFLNITQYGTALTSQSFETFSELLDNFYFEKDRTLRIKRRAGDLFKLLNNAIERIAKKINAQKEDLIRCADKEKLRIYAELINANQYNLEKGAAFYDLENYYENNEIIRISANPAFLPAQNAQKYYKDYKKSHTAEKMLADLIENGEQELIYVESVLDSLSRADTESELAEIRLELLENGYLKKKRGIKGRLPKALPPIEFMSSDGFKILVGRNNTQNDKLSLKTAKNYDMWLHTQSFAGSHTIIVSDNKDITKEAILEAATIAAYYSSARESSKVPVDYTLCKNLKKPQSAKPGKVIYNTYNTIYVKPDKDLAEKLIISK